MWVVKINFFWDMHGFDFCTEHSPTISALLYFWVVVVIGLPCATCRNAHEEICRRFPSVPSCENGSSKINVSPEPARDAPQNSHCVDQRGRFDMVCTGPSENPTGAETATSTFCDSFYSNCLKPGTAQQQQIPQPPQLLAQTQQAQERLQVDDPQKAQYCARYEKGFFGHCSQPSSDPKKAEFCRAYFNYCDMGAKLGSQQPPVMGSQRQSDSPEPFPNANNSAVIKEQCEKYKKLGDQYCPGYEVTEMRKNCNLYRVYCQGKAPFPGIDGNVGFSKDLWALQGIPFYPFNDAGAIAGGSKANVEYGDWGGGYAERSGVSDFYDQSRKYRANWQRGTYDVGEGWQVPLTGIGGFRRSGVSLGGLGNPSDWPNVASGGLLPPASQTESAAGQFLPPSFGSGTPNILSSFLGR